MKPENFVEVDYTFIVNQNGSIQHSNVEYKEDGDVLIDARNEKDEHGNEFKVEFVNKGWNRYAITNATVGNVEFNIEEIDPKTVMAFDRNYDASDSNGEVLSPSTSNK